MHIVTGQYPRRTSGNFMYQLSSVPSHHGSAMSAATIRCQKSFCMEQQMAIVTGEDHVNHGRQRQGMDGPVIVVVAAQRRRLGVT